MNLNNINKKTATKKRQAFEVAVFKGAEVIPLKPELQSGRD